MEVPVMAECFLNVPQEFLVCTTVHKARHLSVFNSDTYVKVHLEKRSKSTKIYHNSDNPYFNEYFVFELTCTLAELLRLTVLYEVKRRTICKSNPTLGELLIDLYTVWNQPHKCFFRKWGKLESSIGSTLDTSGYLQIDLSIVAPNQPPAPAWIANVDADIIEQNLLQNVETSTNVRYSIFFYKGEFIKKSDYLIQVSLAGMNGKTSMRKNTPIPQWNELIEFNWIYPSLAQTFLVQIMSREHLHWKCVAEYEIYFEEISFGVSPSLGPTYIHFYDFHTYVGRVLIEIRSEKLTPAKETLARAINVKSTLPFEEKALWTYETFVVEFLTWQGEFIHANASNIKMCLRIGGHVSETIECFLKNYDGFQNPLKYFTQQTPFKALHVNMEYPDNRIKYESDVFMVDLVEQWKVQLENFKLFQLKFPQNIPMHSKCLKGIIITLLEKLETINTSTKLQYNGFKKETIWDSNRVKFLKEFFGRQINNLKELRNNLKTDGDRDSICDTTFEDLQKHRLEIEEQIDNRVQDEWPALHLVMSLGNGRNATKDIGICKLNPRLFLNATKAECRGRWSGVPKNFVFKDATCNHSCRNCGCVRGFVYGWLRIATEAELAELSVSGDWEERERFYYRPKVESTNLQCRLYLHQGKVQPGSDRTGLCDAKLIVSFGNEMVQTSVAFATLSPVWNEMVYFSVRKMPGPLAWYEKNPPLLGVQVYDVDASTSDDYLGCGLVELSVPKLPIPHEETVDVQPIEAQCQLQKPGNKGKIVQQLVKTKVALDKLNELRYQSPPLLKWVTISNMGVSRVEILVSGELLESNERDLSSSVKAALVKGIPKEIQPVMARYLLEITFAGLRNCYKIGYSTLGRYKIHLMMGELLLKSGLSGSKLKNSINFLENFASGVVNLPEQFEYWPPIIATLIDCQGRKRELTIAAAIITNPSKYLQKTPITCNNFENNEPTVLQIDELNDDETAALLPPTEKKATRPPKPKVVAQIQSFRPKEGALTRMCYWISSIIKRKPVTPPIYDMDVMDESDFNWWTKFYNSMHLLETNAQGSSKHRLTIFKSELEKELDFEFMHEWAEGFQLVHGVKLKRDKPPKEELYAVLKLHIKLSPCLCNTPSTVTLSAYTGRIPPKVSQNIEETKVVVRVYIVQGVQLRSHDKYSQSDSYVKLLLGPHIISDRAHYVPNQSNPIFGKRFQMEAMIPREHILQISVYDRGGLQDNLIGSTFIDLEDRLRSKHRATVGIANEFNTSGYNLWRDPHPPSDILKRICRKHKLPPPWYENDAVIVDGVLFKDSTELSTQEDLQERLSLSALKNIHQVPSIGYRLIPEHVETRSLYRNDRPGVEQGKLQLWVELYDGGIIPPPLDITPSPARPYELRLIIYNCSDVTMTDRNIFGKKMSDIYIKAWCEEPDLYQTTDVHYRSLNGEGNFNWRMVFPIRYSAVEDMMVIKRKTNILQDSETKQPPVLHIQIWEDDAFSPDDFIAACEINLSHFPEPFATKAACTEKRLSTEKHPHINIFREKEVKGWFPCRGLTEKGDITGIAGKLELEIQMLTESDAQSNPVGLGRSPPHPLPTPDRPDTSFNPLTNPLKSMKHIILPICKKLLQYLIALVIVFFVVKALILELPGRLIDKILGT